MSFGDGIKRFMESTDRAAKDAVEDITEELIDDIVDLTPKETGNAAANWNVGSTEEDYWDENDDAWQANRQEQKRKVGSLARMAIDSGKDIVISNPTPYIQLLEDGRSNEAPAGMVKIAKLRAKTRRTL